eukprot:CAMPEP_0117489756 /NCGR_PEP_ID=MMETSP0784-20121206/17200_1 /TAXON_ID=39447 /ORGANISM="" /LENGTH=234 /DNA_ID=CAMNT_0005284495 /DNA_START=37 /DNA_END=741 /DNA_ORIENTATION=-
MAKKKSAQTSAAAQGTVKAQEGSTKGQFPKVKGTQIQFQKGGKPVRICSLSGKTFDPNNIKAVEKHLRKLESQGLPALLSALTSQANQAQGGKKKKKKKAKKELTPEQIEERRAKNAEKHAAKVALEQRHVVSGAKYTAEVVMRGFASAWVKLTSPKGIPGAVQAKLKAMNEERRAKAAEGAKAAKDGDADVDLVYCHLGDIAEQGLVLKPGIQVKMKLYTDTKGVGGCEITSA